VVLAAGAALGAALLPSGAAGTADAAQAPGPDRPAGPDRAAQTADERPCR
jgi:hypothetical protein